MMTGDNNKNPSPYMTLLLLVLRRVSLIFICHTIFIPAADRYLTDLLKRGSGYHLTLPIPHTREGFNSSQISISLQAKNVQITYTVQKIDGSLSYYFLKLSPTFGSFLSGCLHHLRTFTPTAYFQFSSLISHLSLIFHISRHLFTPVHT